MEMGSEYLPVTEKQLLANLCLKSQTSICKETWREDNCHVSPSKYGEQAYPLMTLMSTRGLLQFSKTL